MGKSYYYVEVETLAGETICLQLPNDLQGAMRAYRQAHPITWENLLADALINIPSATYSKENNYQPTIRLVRVKRSFSSKKQQRRRTRGQFLTKENWQQDGLTNFRDSLRFIQHDYPRKNKLILLLDYGRWKWRLFKSR